jgi:hypothetical protein
VIVRVANFALAIALFTAASAIAIGGARGQDAGDRTDTNPVHKPTPEPDARSLKVHGIFRSNMVLQRDKPITIWGWAATGAEVEVSFGKQSATAKATGNQGRWEANFKAQPANAQGQMLSVRSGDEHIEMDNILIGDIWVMNGQSNMAYGLRAVYEAEFEASMAHLPLLRHIRINPNESEHVITVA